MRKLRAGDGLDWYEQAPDDWKAVWEGDSPTAAAQARAWKDGRVWSYQLTAGRAANGGTARSFKDARDLVSLALRRHITDSLS